MELKSSQGISLKGLESRTEERLCVSVRECEGERERERFLVEKKASSEKYFGANVLCLQKLLPKRSEHLGFVLVSLQLRGFRVAEVTDLEARYFVITGNY